MELTREFLLESAIGGNPEPVNLPEIGGELYIRTFSTATYFQIMEIIESGGDDEKPMLIAVLEAGISNIAGNKILRPGDGQALLEKFGNDVIFKIVEKIMDKNGFSVGRVEEDKKKSEESPG